MSIFRILSSYFISSMCCSFSLKVCCRSLNSIAFSVAIALLCWTCTYCANMEFFSTFFVPNYNSSLLIISKIGSSTFSLTFLPIGRSSPPHSSIGVSSLQGIIGVDGMPGVLGVSGEELLQYAPGLFTFKRLDATSAPSSHKVFHFGTSFSRIHQYMKSNLFSILCS